ncbi:hypothetical protein [Sphingorhabdus sp. SMR4y]|uniref:hypothetical protein n=1 Tax=Sphingorhabdus sp. SMR4y TaxID=2584094 RepID=UPI00163F7EB7|nr:hypothetical protein [Sphingorhabdus sp. SMR4y]
MVIDDRKNPAVRARIFPIIWLHRLASQISGDRWENRLSAEVLAKADLMPLA